MKIFLQGDILTAADLNANFAEGAVNTAAQYTFTNVISFANSISANGSNGTAGYVLTSNGSGVYWSYVSGAGGGIDVNAQYTLTNTITHSGRLVLSNTVTANGSNGTAGQVLSSNGNGVYWSTLTGVNTAAQISFTNNISFSAQTTFSNSISVNGSVGSNGYVLMSGGSAHNTYWYDISSIYTSQSQLASNLANYVTSTVLTGTLVNYVDFGTIAGYVTTAQLTSNLENYAYTGAGTTTFNGNVSVTSNLSVSGTILIGGGSVNSTFFTGKSATANVANTANNVLYVGGTSAANVVSNAQLQANLTNYASLSNPSFTGNGSFSNNLTVNNLSSTYDLNVGRNVTIAGNLTVTGTTVTVSAANFTTSDNLLYLNEAKTLSITGASGNGSAITYTVNNSFAVGGVANVSGITPSGFNSTGYVTVTAANSTTFSVANTFTGTYVSGGTVAYKTAINPDLGFAGGYNDGTYHHSGLFRNHSTGVWTFFDNYTPEPDAAVNIVTTDPSFHLANIAANNITITGIIVNSSLGSANAILTSNGSGSYWATPAPKFINIAWTGTNLGPSVGTVRYYPPVSLSISQVYAQVSSAASSGVVFKLFKNGADTGYTFTINSGQFTMAGTSVSISLTSSDYLTLNLVSGTAVELRVQLQYTTT